MSRPSSFPRFLTALTLRAKVALVFILPLALTLALILAFHYSRTSRTIDEQLERTTLQLGQITLGSLRHAMFRNDLEALAVSLRDIAARETIERVWIVDLTGTTRHSSEPSQVGRLSSTAELGCSECHQFAPGDRPQVVRLTAAPDILRVSVPIANDPECQSCHAGAQTHLGVLFIDASLVDQERSLSREILLDLVLALLALGASLSMGFVLVRWLIVRRVELIHQALARFGTGDFSVRIPVDWRTEDELTQLADQLNRIAAQLDALQADRQERERVREQAIIEERERIARELHDGVAQFLGYLSTKLAAVRLALGAGRVAVAEQNLEQVEQAIRSQSVEVRAAIIGLKMSADLDRGLAYNIRQYVEQSSRLSDLPLALELPAGVEQLTLGAERELQLMRILQEAVSNIRKHARAARAVVSLRREPGQLILTISDDGVGFDPLQAGLEGGGHFGLKIMFERARSIDAVLEIKSAPGEGTHLSVRLDLQE